MTLGTLLTPIKGVTSKVTGLLKGVVKLPQNLLDRIVFWVLGGAFVLAIIFAAGRVLGVESPPQPIHHEMITNGTHEDQITS